MTYVHDVMAMVIQTFLCILFGGKSIGEASLQGPGQFCQTSAADVRSHNVQSAQRRINHLDSCGNEL